MMKSGVKVSESNSPKMSEEIYANIYVILKTKTEIKQSSFVKTRIKPTQTTFSIPARHYRNYDYQFLIFTINFSVS